MSKWLLAVQLLGQIPELIFILNLDSLPDAGFISGKGMNTVRLLQSMPVFQRGSQLQEERK